VQIFTFNLQKNNPFFLVLRSKNCSPAHFNLYMSLPTPEKSDTCTLGEELLPPPEENGGFSIFRDVSNFLRYYKRSHHHVQDRIL